MGRGMGRRRKRAGDRIALRGGGGAATQLGGATLIGGGGKMGGGAAKRTPELSAIEKALLAQARGPGLIVQPGMSLEQRWAVQALSVRRLIKKSGKTETGQSIYRAK